MNNLSENLVEFYEQMTAWESSVVRDSGLTLAQTHAVEVLGNNGSLRMKDLAAKLGVTMGTLTVMVDRLSAMGLMERKPNAEDGRSFQLKLTWNGEKLHAMHHQHHEVFAKELTSNIPPEEIASFSLTLDKILKNLN
jgi:DNA-binding MarR family transcriptional regulator